MRDPNIRVRIQISELPEIPIIIYEVSQCFEGSEHIHVRIQISEFPESPIIYKVESVMVDPNIHVRIQISESPRYPSSLR